MKYEVGKFYVRNRHFMPEYFLVVEVGESFVIVCNADTPNKHEAFKIDEDFRLHELDDSQVDFLKRKIQYAQADYDRARQEMYEKELIKGYLEVALHQLEQKDDH